MANRRALVNLNGVIAELPTGDSLTNGLPSILSILNHSSSIVQITISSNILPVLNRAGSTISVPIS